MKKRWKVVLIISLILILAEAAAAVIYVLPVYYKAAFFKAIEETKLETAEEILDKDFGFVKRAVETELNDYIVYHANEYLEDKAPYEDVKTLLVNIEHMKAFEGRTEDAFAHMNAYELLKIYEDAAADYVVNSGGRTDYINEDIVLNYSNAFHVTSYYFNYDENFTPDYSVRVGEQLDTYLEGKYNQYKEGKLEYKNMNAYVQVAYQYFPDTTYTKSLVSELSNAGAIDAAFQSASDAFDEGNYVEAVRQCDTAATSYAKEEGFDLYKNQFEELRTKAYEEGKKSYKDIVKKLIDEGKIDEAKALIDAIEELYGNDIDMKAIREVATPDWKKAYKDYTADSTAKLEKAAGDGVMAADLFNSKDITVSEHVPANAATDDLDDDGMPELLLYNDDFIYVLTCDFDGVHLTGCFKYSGFADGKLMAFGIKNPNDIYVLVYEDGKWTLDSSLRVKTSEDGKNTYFNGNEEVSDEEYVKLKDSLMAKKVGVEGGVPIADAATLFE